MVDGLSKSSKKVTIDEAKNKTQQKSNCMTISQDISNDLKYFEQNGRFSVSPAPPPGDEGSSSF